MWLIDSPKDIVLSMNLGKLCSSFPRKGDKAKKPVTGCKTGDIINLIKDKNAGLKELRIKTVRSKGNFDIRDKDKILSVSRNHIQPIQKQDG